MASLDELLNRMNSISDDLSGAQAFEVRYNGDIPQIWQGGELIKDFSDQKAKAGELMETIGGFDSLVAPDWNDYSADYQGYKQGFNENLNALNNPAQRQQDIADSRQYSAEMLGYDDWTGYQDDVSNMRGQLNAGIGGMEGYTADEEQKFKEFQQRQMNDMRDDLAKQADAVMASTGSTMNYLMAADEARKQISNEQLRGELSFMQQDFERKAMQFEAMKDQLWQQVQAGVMTTEQFLDNVREDRMNALQGYAAGMNQTLQKYQTDIGAYSSEVQALGAHADSMYKAIMVDIGIDQAALDYATSMYDAQIQPLINEMTAIGSQANIMLQREANDLTRKELNKEAPTLWDSINPAGSWVDPGTWF